MKIDSGLGGTYYQSRALDNSKTLDDANQMDASSAGRGVGGVTSGGTPISNSFANALWQIDSASGSQMAIAPARQDWLNNLYSEFN
ncbi:MAG: hypothetical protein PW791_14115 [Neorhizobium sp.]|jgi:hypothetical protein|nr:hypothetical protein [Neorhizobium sp.]